MTYKVDRIDILPKTNPNNPAETTRWRGQLTNGSESIICFFTPEIENSPTCNMQSISVGSFINPTKYFKKNMKGTDVLIVSEFQLVNTTPGTSFPTQPNLQQQSTLPTMPIVAAAPSAMIPPGRVLPINALNPYNSTWTIRVRVTAKGDVKTWTNQRGSGKLFSVDLCDSHGGEIRAVGFNEACDKWEPILKQGQVYYISNGNLRGAKKQFSAIKNDYQIVFSDKTKIQIDSAATSDIPALTFNFADSIDSISNFTANAQTDVVGVVQQVNPTETLISKRSGDELTKREITLVDESGKSIALTLWSATAQNFSETEVGSIYAVKGCKVSDFGGKSLSMVMGGSLAKNPDHPRAHRLRTWYDQTGKTLSFESMSSGVLSSGGSPTSRIHTISDVLEATPEGVILEKPSYFNIPFAYITSIHNNNAPWYTSAPEGSGTMAKVTEQMDGKWRCAANGMVYDKATYRYTLRFSIDDESGSLLCNAFNMEAQGIMGISADDLHAMQLQDQALYETQFALAVHNFKAITIQAKNESYQGNTRVRYGAFRISDVDPVAYSKLLIAQINEIIPAELT